jgi:hypothetical protein
LSDGECQTPVHTIDFSVTTAALAMTIGAIVGALLALFGDGGSVLATPLLLYVVGARDPHVAIGASAATAACDAATNVVGHPLSRPEPSLSARVRGRGKVAERAEVKVRFGHCRSRR